MGANVSLHELGRQRNSASYTWRNPFHYGCPDIIFYPENSRLPNKEAIVESGEELLKTYDSEACRKVAIENYSIEKSVERMLSYK